MVEKWLSQVEAQMMASLRDVAERAVISYVKTARECGNVEGRGVTGGVCSLGRFISSYHRYHIWIGNTAVKQDLKTPLLATSLRAVIVGRYLQGSISSIS